MEEEYPQEELFRRLEERLLQPDVRKSAEDLDDLLADDFMETGSSGRVFNKRQIIESLQQEPPTQRSLTDFKSFTLAPDLVLVTYRAVQQRSSEEPPVYSRRCSIWKSINGRWQMVFHQGTPAQQS